MRQSAGEKETKKKELAIPATIIQSSPTRHPHFFAHTKERAKEKSPLEKRNSNEPRISLLSLSLSLSHSLILFEILLLLSLLSRSLCLSLSIYFCISHFPSLSTREHCPFFSWHSLLLRVRYTFI